MRYSISLVVLTLLAALALKGSFHFQSARQQPLLVAANSNPNGDDSNQYNTMSSVNPNPPNGLNDQSAQLWRTLSIEQKNAVLQDIQNGMDPNQAVLNYSQQNNLEPANVEDSGSHPTSENYDAPGNKGADPLENSLNNQNNGSKPDQTNKMTSDAKDYSGSGSTEDEDETDDQNKSPKDPSNRTIYTPGSENSPAPGNNW